ncbi:Two-component sensor histidine kinase, contains HisKA and HATPase domains [Devosia sp. YR412]|uniref:sensor histidine kinase n=1 Tax=Devosia sp. YR412 TaxID=1881030 RepID=UPI0008BD2258|nr:CHASE3 domain-containing protein [Devosia sp. YR412]SEQ08075.1 Two-component sensor histidine kinase, contains HisKA and HATPase domains [Devosia sp. YR412]
MTAISMADGISSRRSAARPDRQVLHNIAVLVSLGLVLLAAISALGLVQGINRQITDISHTYEVRNQARELTNALSGAESAQRGYLLTRDDSYLDSYHQASSSIGNRLLALTGLTKDDPQQAVRVRDIAGEIVVKSAEMDRMVTLVQEERPGDARRLIETGVGERLMGSLQESLERFIEEENTKLLDRNRQIDHYRRWLVGAIITALAGAVILAYALFLRAQKQVSELARSRERLHSENEVLEAHVADRTQALEEARTHAEQERQRVESLLQDANHRIGNSLATVSSLLGLQVLRSQSDEVRNALEAARSRVHAIASAHRRLRLGDDFETTSADEFLGAVLEDIALTADGTKSVELLGQFHPIHVGARDATTIGILVGELVTNALKHAFPEGRPGSIHVSLEPGDAGVPVLKVVDDGVGLPDGVTPGEGGLGSVIVSQLANQFGGIPQYERRPEGGLSVSVPMPGLTRSTG